MTDSPITKSKTTRKNIDELSWQYYLENEQGEYNYSDNEPGHKDYYKTLHKQLF
jgi:hypothetical protein